MSLLGVSAPFLIAAWLGGAGARIQMSPPASALRSLVEINGPNSSKAYAVLIDRHGLFLAHSSVVVSEQVPGKTYSGKIVLLSLVSLDEPTQLALFEARQWLEPGIAPIQVASPKEVLNRPVFAILGSTSVRGDVVAIDRPGVMKPSLRYVPLSEIRLEAQQSPARLGGAPVFTKEGKLAGLLGATLEPLASPSALAGGMGTGMRAAPGKMAGQPTFGPVGMTVGYSLGIDVLQRVVQGFTSPSRRPIHPTIGVFYRDSAEKGAVVEAVVGGSTAEKAGILQGDVIVGVDDQEIGNAFDLATILFRQKVGSTLKVLLRRGASRELLTIMVPVGQLPDKSANQRKILQIPLDVAGPIVGFGARGVNDVHKVPLR